MNEHFDKRVFTASLLLKDSWFLLSHVWRLIAVFRNADVTSAFVEKIMIVITAVNGCAYCAWFHAKQAVAAGIEAEEVRGLFDLQFQAQASDFEMMALLYAQHYAETNRRPEAEMTTKLVDSYGERTAMHILFFIRIIFFGNLFGNTWDAVLSRLKGKPAPNSSIIFEAVFFLSTFWFMFPTMWLVRK